MNDNMTKSKELGKMLSAQRESLKLSVEDVNNGTRIHPGVIKDMENGEFRKLGPVYVKSFLSKYSSFLGLDNARIIKLYEELSHDIPEKSFSVDNPPEKIKKTVPSLPSLSSQKKIQIVAALLLSGVLLILFFVLVSVARSVFTSSPREKTPPAAVSTVTPQERKDREETVQDLPSAGPTLASRIKRAVTAETPSREVSLTLKARDEVWIQVRSGDRKLFDGFLKDGQSRSWGPEESLTVWTGKADMLDFSVNGNDLGVVAAGVVRNINVSHEGIQIGNEWVKRFR